MKKGKNRWAARLIGLLLVSYTLLTATVMATGGAGSQGDPLVTLSYLNETFLGQILAKVDERLDTRDQELSDKLDARIDADVKTLREQYGSGTGGAGGEDAPAGSFAVVTLSSGQTLYGEIGCEVMLRVGTASCVAPASPGLIDETDGTTVGNGAALTKNHLCMMTVEGRGVKATAATTKLLVRGGYELR